MMRRNKAFTLIELLVVIAIIGILASMVFPVFARARESARKVVCLSNVKNIALAIQMYLADNNDTLPPSEHRQDVAAYFQARGDDASCTMPTTANPYLEWPVILDEYVKNRDVWRCPSAKLIGSASFIYGSPDWFGELLANEGAWGDDFCPYNPFPNGWGGVITDSLSQGLMSLGSATNQFAEKVFTQTINWNGSSGRDLKLTAVDDPVNFIICGDGAPEIGYMIPGTTTYPDICGVACAACDYIEDEHWWPESNEWEFCAEFLESGCSPQWSPPSFIREPSLRKPYARHLGGVNVGFLDGHAAWWNSDGLLAKIAEGKGADMMGLTWSRYESQPASWCVLEETGKQWPTLF